MRAQGNALNAEDAACVARGRSVIRAERDALSALETFLDAHFSAACRLIASAKRQLSVTGMGKSGHIARKIAATFAATGTPATFIHPGEAGHGDLGMMAKDDILLVLSNSGNTAELRPIINYARRLRIPVIGMASRKSSMVIEYADIPLLVPQVREACPANLAPTTSTAMQLALGDALAMTVMEMKGIRSHDLRKLHPAGTIGLALTPVSELMHHHDRLPLVGTKALMPEVISCMTAGCFGLAGVVDASGALVGIMTDGDLRRRFTELATARAEQIMTCSPKTVPPEMLAQDVLTFLNDHAITAAFVVPTPEKGPQPPLGIVHIHDLLRLGLN